MKVASAGNMSVEGPEFREAVTAIIRERNPKRIIETGTYLGLGTTKIVADALGANYYNFFTIEANPFSYAEACQNLKEYPDIRVLNGYSIPKRLMPTEAVLIQWLDALKHEDIYVDFQEYERIGCYMREAGHNVPYNLLENCFRYFGGTADLIVLDSSGHMGFIEFNYVLALLNAGLRIGNRNPCVFVLDDTRHVKHFQSLAQIKEDPHFTLLKESDEKFGFCIAEWRSHVR